MFGIFYLETNHESLILTKKYHQCCSKSKQVSTICGVKYYIKFHVTWLFYRYCNKTKSKLIYVFLIQVWYSESYLKYCKIINDVQVWYH